MKLLRNELDRMTLDGDDPAAFIRWAEGCGYSAELVACGKWLPEHVSVNGRRVDMGDTFVVTDGSPWRAN